MGVICRGLFYNHESLNFQKFALPSTDSPMYKKLFIITVNCPNRNFTAS